MKFKSLNATQKSTLLAALASLGVGATMFVTAQCTRKADKKETTKEKAIAYVPAIGAGAVTVLCIAASTKVSHEEIAGLTVACAAIAQKYTNYRKAVENVADERQKNEINELFYLNEIARLEEEVERYEHPTDDDDWCTFIDSYSAYTFRAPYDQVDEGIQQAKEAYVNDEFLAWSDIFYLANNKDTMAHDSALGNNYYTGGIGWSKNMLDEIYEGEDFSFDIFLRIDEKRPNTFWIDYSVLPEPCYLEY